MLQPARKADRKPMPAKALTPGQRWKLRRDLVIYLAARHGASQRLQADVFDLPHSRVSVIIRRFREQHGGEVGG